MSRRGFLWAVLGAAIGALLVGAYVLSGRGSDEPVESAHDPFARLAARPLKLPRHLASDRGCRLDVGVIPIPGVPSEGGLGPLAQREEQIPPVLRKGPVYAVLGGVPRVMDLRPVSGGRWAAQEETLWISRPGYDGPVLVRGGRLGGRARIRFGSGADPRLELRLGAGEWDEPRTARWHAGPLRLRHGWRVAVTSTRIKASGCYAFQVDGEGFGYVLPFAAVVQTG